MTSPARRAALHRLVDAIIDLVDDDGTALTAIPVQGQVLSTDPDPDPVSPGDRRIFGARKAPKEVLHTFGPTKPADAIRQVLIANPALTVDQVRRAFHAAKRANLTSDDGGVWRWLDSDPT